MTTKGNTYKITYIKGRPVAADFGLGRLAAQGGAPLETYENLLIKALNSGLMAVALTGAIIALGVQLRIFSNFIAPLIH